MKKKTHSQAIKALAIDLSLYCCKNRGQRGWWRLCVYGFDGLTCGDKLGLLHVHKSKHGRPRKEKKKFKKKKKKKNRRLMLPTAGLGKLQVQKRLEVRGSDV